MTQALLGVIAVGAGFAFARSRRLPNWLTLGGAIVAVLWAFGSAGWSGLWNAAGGWIAAMALLTPLVLVRLAGPGDLKLAGALGASAGLAAIGPLGLSFLCVALVWAVSQSIRTGSLRRVLAWGGAAIGLMRLGLSWKSHLLEPASGRIPLAYVISAAGLVLAAVQTVQMWG